MVLSEVLSIACANSGIDLPTTASYRAQHERAIHLFERHPEATELGQLARAGPHFAGILLAKFSLREALRRLSIGTEMWTPNAETLATVAAFGETLVNSAISCLPQVFVFPTRYEANEVNLDLPCSLSALKRHWLSGSRATQLEVATLLAQTFCPKTDRKLTAEQDRLDQPIERVLPWLYGPWDISKLGNRANCAGKATLVAAFGRLIQVPMLAVIPLAFSSSVLNDFRGQGAEIILRTLQETGIVLSETRHASLRGIIERGEKERSRASSQHLAIAFKLRKNGWVLIDPNLGLASEMPEHWEFESLAHTLTETQAVLPGLSLFREDLTEERLLEREVEAIREACEKLKELRPYLKTPEAFVSGLAPSTLLDEILCWDWFATLRDREYEREYQAACILLEFTLRSQSAKEANFQRPWQSKFYGTRDELFRDIPESWQQEGLVTFCYRFIGKRLDSMIGQRELERLSGKLMHPKVQVSHVHYALGNAVLAHVALLQSRSLSERVETLLYSQSLDQFRLLHVASGQFRDSSIPHEDSRRALDVLRQLPLKLYSAERLLEHCSS